MSQHGLCGLVTDELCRMHGYVTRLILYNFKNL